MIAQTEVPSRVRVYVVLTLLGLGAAAALVTLYCNQDVTGRNTLLIEMGKGLIQLIAIGIIGAVVKFLFGSYQSKQQLAEQNRQQMRARNDAINDFRRDKIRRLVQVTNAIRRFPILLEAHRSAKTYNEQMRGLVDASLELQLIRHEIDAIGPGVENPAFPGWPSIRDAIRGMEQYFRGIQTDWGRHSKRVSELQREAEKERSRKSTVWKMFRAKAEDDRLAAQNKVWEDIKAISSVEDLLKASDASSQETKFHIEYLTNYQTALDLMVKASLFTGEKDDSA
jgi:hypothetical protein